MNNKELKKKECLFEIADDYTNGMDIYNHNGSFWLINTKELKWMIEFTKDKTLWYNYNIFKSLFKAMSLDVMKNQVYITEWFESRFLKPEVVEDTIQNGVRHTNTLLRNHSFSVEDTIQNGVRHTDHPFEKKLHSVEDAIQNGVKINGIYVGGKRQKENVDVVIDYGVKETYDDCSNNIARVEGIVRIGGVIKNGIKEVQPLPAQDGVKQTELSKRDFFPEDILQNGVKRTVPESIADSFAIKDTIQNGIKRTQSNDWIALEFVTDAIQYGVKDTIPTLRRTLLGVDDIIQNGVKHIFNRTRPDNFDVEDAIQNGVKHTEEGLFITISDIKDVTQNGVKHTEYGDWIDGDKRIRDIAQNGVKVLQPLPAQDGNMDWGNYYHGKEDRTKPFNEYLNDAIRFGDQVLFPHNFNKLKNLQQ